MFQEDMCLPVTGKADLNTWMSLLLSSGNPERPATVCDTRFEITEARAEHLKDLGYTTVGRYFPIFQESATDLSYFTYNRGKEDAIKAVVV